MKNLLANIAVLAVLAFGTNMAMAETLSCNGSGYAQTQPISGFCSNGYCTGWIQSQNVNAGGRCDKGVTFDASAYTSSSMISGSCWGGGFNFFTSSQYLNFSGRCSNGSTFSGSSYMNGTPVSGTCSPNGAFTAWTYTSSVMVSGSCQ